MSRGMAVSGYANDTAIAEQIMLTVDQLELVAKIKIGAIVTVATYLVGVCRRVPFAALHDHLRIGQVCVAADVVEVQMRINHIVDTSRINAACRKPRS